MKIKNLNRVFALSLSLQYACITGAHASGNEVEPPKTEPTATLDLSALYLSSWETVEKNHRSALPSTAPSAKTLIVIAPGHGIGKDKGAHSPHTSLWEKEIIDHISDALGDLVAESENYDVSFTREPFQSSRFVNYMQCVGNMCLSPRQAYVEQAVNMGMMGEYKNTILIAIHADTISNTRLQGSTVYASSQGNHNGKVDYGGPVYRAQSKTLSNIMAQNLKDSGRAARTKTADIEVIEQFDRASIEHNQNHNAAILVELGYLSNKQDTAWLVHNAQNPQAIAGTLFEGIKKYQNTLWPEDEYQQHLAITGSTTHSTLHQ